MNFSHIYFKNGSVDFDKNKVTAGMLVSFSHSLITLTSKIMTVCLKLTTYNKPRWQMKKIYQQMSIVFMSTQILSFIYSFREHTSS